MADARHSDEAHRALVTTSHGGLEVMRLGSRPTRTPAEGEVRVRVAAAAFNHLDLWVRRGEPAGHWPTPIVPCADGAGEVVEVGPGVELSPGTLVALYPVVSCGECEVCSRGRPQICRSFGLLGETVDGCAQEYVTLSARDVVPLPDGLDPVTAAAIPTTFITALHMLTDRARLSAGERVLVHGAASGVGSAAIQLANELGAHVVATGRRDVDLELATRLGAREVLRVDDPSWSKGLRGDAAVDVVCEHVGAATWSGSVRALKRGGRLVTCGATTGHEVSLNLRKLFFHSIELIGSTMGTRDNLITALKMVAEGRVRPLMGARRPLEEGAEAMGLLESRSVQGKVVLTL